MPARRFRISFLALILVSLASESHAQTLSGEADKLDRPRLGGVVRNAGPIKVGRGVITPGGTVRVLLAGDEPCGLWIGGPSTLSYRVEAAPEAAPAAAPEWLAPLLDRPFYDAPHLTLLAERRVAGSGPGVVHGLFHGRTFDLRLVIDPRGDRQEVLFDLERIPRADSVVYQGRYYGQELAAQPIGRSWWEHPPAALVAEHQSFKIDNDQKRHVTVTTTTRVRSTADLAGLWWATLSGEVTEENRSFPITVRTVEVNGRPADFLFRNDTLTVALDPPLRRDQTAEIKVVNEGDYAIRYGGDSFWSLGTWAWFPTPPFHGWLATMDFEVRVPDPLVPFVSGTTTGKESRDGFTVVKSQLDRPMQWPVVAAGKYNVYSDRQLDVAATYVRANERGAKRLLNNFYAATECYQKLLNVPFPFSEVEVIEINQWGFGQAPPGVIFITQEAFNSVLDETDRLFSEGINGRYLHEIAHSYWPHVPKMNSEEENWTSESFADYTSAVCLDQLAGGKGTFRFQNSLDHWRGNVKDLGDGASLYLANHLAGVNFNDVFDRQNLLYSKGPVVLHALRLELQKQAGSVEKGDRQFWSLLRSYLKSFPYKWAGTRHLVGILNQITGSDWQPWFERYVYGTEIPVVR